MTKNTAIIISYCSSYYKWQSSATSVLCGFGDLYTFYHNVPSKHGTFTQCQYNVGPASQTVGQH